MRYAHHNKILQLVHNILQYVNGIQHVTIAMNHYTQELLFKHMMMIFLGLITVI